MKKRIIQESKLVAVSLAVGVLMALGVAAYTYVYSAAAQREIAENVIRFHVMANSNSEADQNLKEYVRLEVLAEFAEAMAEAECLEATRALLTSSLPAIQTSAENAIRRAGYSYPVTASMKTVFFPTRFYGDMAFPPGEYEAVQITIGDGAGENWWCLMFPPLCYLDMTSTAAGRRLLSGSVSEGGVQLLMYREEESTEVAVRFRIVEWWQNRNQPAPDTRPATYELAGGR